MRFLGYNQYRLRQLFHFVQTKVMEIRQHYQQQGQLWKEYANSLVQQAGDGSALPAGYNPNMAEQLNVAAVSTQAPQQLDGSMPQQLPQQATPMQRMPIHPSAYHTVAPVVSAYTRLPMMSRQRRFLGSRAVHAPIPPIYNRQTTSSMQ
jgi:hypothetical protein